MSFLPLLSRPGLMASLRLQHDTPKACHHSLQVLLQQLGLSASCCSRSLAGSGPDVTPEGQSTVACQRLSCALISFLAEQISLLADGLAVWHHLRVCYH